MATEQCSYWDRQEFRKADEGIGPIPRESMERLQEEHEREDAADPPCGKCATCYEAGDDAREREFNEAVIRVAKASFTNVEHLEDCWFVADGQRMLAWDLLRNVADVLEFG